MHSHSVACKSNFNAGGYPENSGASRWQLHEAFDKLDVTRPDGKAKECASLKRRQEPVPAPSYDDAVKVCGQRFDGNTNRPMAEITKLALDFNKANVDPTKAIHGIGMKNKMELCQDLMERNKYIVPTISPSSSSLGSKSRSPKSKKSCGKRSMRWVKKSPSHKGYCRPKHNMVTRSKSKSKSRSKSKSKSKSRSKSRSKTRSKVASPKVFMW